uniref:Uncharacterized protein n=1 Tax=Ditylenchus dipsaci TaxID=166011 RepID=A0A915E382_9BILA
MNFRPVAIQKCSSRFATGDLKLLSALYGHMDQRQVILAYCVKHRKKLFGTKKLIQPGLYTLSNKVSFITPSFSSLE